MAKPRESSKEHVSLNIAGLPHTMTRSCAGSSWGRPRSRHSFPESSKVVSRPWLGCGSRGRDGLPPQFSEMEKGLRPAVVGVRLAGDGGVVVQLVAHDIAQELVRLQ